MTVPLVTRAKFDSSGRALDFPGTSIVCPVAADSPLFEQACRAQRWCREAGLADLFAFLPPASFHVTLFDLLCYQVRTPERWSRLLPLGCPPEEADRRTAELLRTVSFPGPPSMSVTGLGPPLGHTLHLRLEPSGPFSEQLRDFRDAVSRATGIRHPNHESYFFHLSLAYPLSEIGPHERERHTAFEARAAASLQGPATPVGPPHLAYFDDMLAFPNRRPR